MEYIPECVKKLREKLSLSQQAFATALGVSMRGVANWESGARKPDAEILAALIRLARERKEAKLARQFQQELEGRLGLKIQ